MKSRKADIFDDVKTVLDYYQALGYETIPLAVDQRRGKEVRHGSNKADLLQKLREELGDCRRCKLSQQRKNIVFGEGNPNARLMFIGEAPGKEEDIQGRPFVGEAGTLLTRLIEKMDMKRADVYIANMVKCRPPLNRDPEHDEIKTCRIFIEKQIEIVRPEVIITLGRIALQSLAQDHTLKITSARGHFFDYENIPVMPTFHPAYLLRNPKDKWLTWSDAQKVMEILNSRET